MGRAAVIALICAGLAGPCRGAPATADSWPVLPDQPGQGRVALAWSGYDGVDPDRLSLSLRQAAGTTTSLGVDAISLSDGDWAATAVVRQDVSGPVHLDGVSVIAGVGARETADETRATFRIGGRIERGLHDRDRIGGWISLDAEARVGADAATELAGSTQLGVTAWDRLSLSGGIEVTGTTDADRLDTRLSSAVVGQLGDRAHVAVGASVGLDPDDASPGLHIGTWLEF